MDESPNMIEGTSNRSVILSRVMLVGEGIIPKSAFSNLSKAEWHIWMTEPEIEKFQSTMDHLRKMLEELEDTEE